MTNEEEKMENTDNVIEVQEVEQPQNETPAEEKNAEGTKKATGWLIATYIFAALGGLLGLIIGLCVYRDKQYLRTHRNWALFGAILSVISMIIWKIAYA